jgi:predicted outer membrane repeat protein
MVDDNKKTVFANSVKTISKLLIISMLIALAGMINVVSAATWYVSTEGNDIINSGTNWLDSFKTIQKGIDEAVNGDTVLVADGTYSGTGNFDIKFWGKQITVQSVNGPTTCIIDCNDLGRAFLLDWGETIDSVLDGFTILDGNTNGTYAYGGGILCQGAYPIIKNCIFISNTGGQWGGALDVRNSPIYGDTQVINCVFIDNSASYAGGAISTYSSAPKFVNCTFYANSAGSFGGAVALGSPDFGTSFVNCIFWDNSPGAFYGNPTATYSLVPGGYEGMGNIDIAPEFVDSDNGDFRLSAGSDCIDAGNNSVTGIPIQDLDGKPRFIDGDDDMTALVDMGAYEYGDIGECDFNEDLDVDGADLSEFINHSAGYTLADFAEDFGRADCPYYAYSP